ncbi:MAG: glycosyltransferase family 2 protein [Planctomycetota bacterium]
MPAVPRITVVTPSFNQSAFVRQTIESVLRQDYPGLQYIVVDGGSTDGSVEIIEEYRSEIHKLIIERDQGQSDAICKGLALAEGEFFNWINSDDLLEPGVLARVAADFQRDDDLLALQVRVLGDDSESRSLMESRGLSSRRMLRDDDYAFSQPGLWFRTDVIRNAGGVDPRWHYGMDWDLLVRYLAVAPRVRYLPYVGASFRLHDASKTQVELGKLDQSLSRFHMESALIRDELERTLGGDLVRASHLGRRRLPWNALLTERLDDRNRSPAGLAWKTALDMALNPRVKFTQRAWMTVLRLLSRYARPRFWKQFYGGEAAGYSNSEP